MACQFCKGVSIDCLLLKSSASQIWLTSVRGSSIRRRMIFIRVFGFLLLRTQNNMKILNY